MRALRVLEFGERPQLTEVDMPVPGPGEVLLRIEACGLNFADLLMIKGQYQATPKPPFTLGLEVAGTVTALGEGVTEPALGSRVAVFGGQGGLAEFGAFPAALCVALPDAMDSPTAAAFQVAYGTSHLALTHKAGLASGQTLLVLGAAGGVGLTAVEVGKVLGARVIAVARGPQKGEVAAKAGADIVLDSQEGDLPARLRALGGVDVVYDPVGGDQYQAAIRACKRGATYQVIGFASGEVPQIPANILLVKNITVQGFYWGGYLEFAPDALRNSLADLFDWYVQGRLQPHIGLTADLDGAADALELLRTRKTTGKVVITP